MKVIVSIGVVLVLFLAGMLGAGAGLHTVFGVVLPYLALILFAVGLVYKVLSWVNVPVPFRIPTTSGQQRSLPWIKQAKLDNPSTTTGVIGRMLLEVLFFRSLLKNTRTDLKDGKVTYTSTIWLWLGAMAFHWSMLIIVIRHLRLFTDPVPFPITWVERLDGFLQIGVPAFYITTILFLAALGYLLLRRLLIPQVRYISLINDYFPLMLLLGIGLSGFWLRYMAKTNVTAVKELAIGLVTFSPGIPETPISSLFYGHLFLVCVLLAYLPFSKLLHMAGVFLSPTRNLANNNRAVRHINPWDHPVKVHTYEEYEDDFREKMVKAGIRVDKELVEEQPAEKEE